MSVDINTNANTTNTNANANTNTTQDTNANNVNAITNTKKLRITVNHARPIYSPLSQFNPDARKTSSRHTILASLLLDSLGGLVRVLPDSLLVGKVHGRFSRVSTARHRRSHMGTESFVVSSE